MSWQDRLRTEISFTSPEGNKFTALWRGNVRTIDKRLGMFDFPNVKGTKVQDLDVSAVRYPLTIYFQGTDNDIEADRFFQSCRETGIWNIIHPVRGALDLQLVSVTEQITPLESGNYTQFDTEWIEPLDDSSAPSLTELKSTVSAQIDTVSAAASDQIVSNVLQDTAAAISAFEATVDSVVTSIERFLAPLYERSAEINSQILRVKRGINTLLSEPVLDVISLAGQIQTMIELPALAIADINTRIDAYENFINSALGLSPDTALGKDRSIVATQELALISAMSSIAFVVSTGELTSRAQAIELIDKNASLFNLITNTLDVTQDLFKDEYIDIKYFSQSQAFGDVYKLISTVMAYLLRSVFDLSIEKRFKLEKRRAPIEITISEYGSLGDNDSNFQLFIDSNGLKGNDILILPEGREVVVYL